MVNLRRGKKSAVDNPQPTSTQTQTASQEPSSHSAKEKASKKSVQPTKDTRGGKKRTVNDSGISDIETRTQSSSRRKNSTKPPVKRPRIAAPQVDTEKGKQVYSMRANKGASQKEKTAISAQPKLPKKGRALVINSDSESELEPTATKRPSNSKNAPIEMSESEREDDMEVEESREADHEAGKLLKDEAPTWTSTATAKVGSGKKKGSRVLHNDNDNNSQDGDDCDNSSNIQDQSPRASLTEFDMTSDAPALESEGGLSSIPGDVDLIPSCSDDDGDNEEPPVTPKISGKKAKKLQGELPVVTKKNLALSSKHETPSTSTKTTRKDNDDENAGCEFVWLPRTEIVLQQHTETTRSFKLALKGQTTSIKAVMDLGRKLGCIALIKDEKICGLGSGLKQISLASLLKAAEDLGYDGEGDVAHRLEDGDHSHYIKPLVRYMSQRIALERKPLKALQVATILASLQLDNSDVGRRKAGALVDNGDHIYPQKGCDENQKPVYDYRNPFGADVIPKYISGAFFGNNKFSLLVQEYKSSLLTSSIVERPLELELPKAMVAMAGCVIHAVLRDHENNQNDNFPPIGLENEWKGHIELLQRLEATNKWRYHKLMHDLYLKASHSQAPAQHSLTSEQIIKRVNWDAFAEPLDDDPTVPPAPSVSPAAGTEDPKEHDNGSIGGS